ncbi:MAG: DNA mismatch repair protein MutS [Thermodesulfobacteriota bacterium]
MASETPMIKQYMKIKNRYSDSILFFRLGDFYEMFFEDAKIASKVLGIALTSRNKSEKNPVPLCGVPFHSVEPYIATMLSHGYKVAICEQVEEPSQSKEIVERRVTRVLTPGVIIDSEKLDSKTNNYLASIYSDGKSYGLAYCDISTGKFRTTSFSSLDELKSEIANIEAKEILLPEDLHNMEELISHFSRSWNPLLTTIDPWVWEIGCSREILQEHLKTKTLEPFGLDNHPESIVSCGAIIHYLKQTQIEDMPPLEDPLFIKSTDSLSIDESTKKNLELMGSSQSTKKTGSLLWVLDETLTGMGGRLIRQWLNYPLIDPEKIRDRLDSVEELIEKNALRNKLRNSLREINDIERLIGRIFTKSARPRDLGALRDSLSLISEVKTLSENLDKRLNVEIRNGIDDLADIRELLDRSVVDEPPLSCRDGGIIREGFRKELDGLRMIKRDGRKWIAGLEAKEREATGINSLKIGYNRVFGYYIEITRTNLHLAPDHYIRKQTLVNAERFITPELKDQEERILGAEEEMIELEKGLFEEIRQRVSKETDRIRLTAHLIGMIDVVSSLALVAEKYDYAKPHVCDSTIIDIKESRHPVVERMELGERFVPNDVRLDHEENQFLIITGPNMAGKSTLIRQVALTIIMAQMGSFVPAKEAKIGVVDRIFTRVGASDNLARGQSTFMVEMTETAYILRHTTPKSLVILDEIGRGTSTFDGMSIAWAVAEYLYEAGSMVLFATHYHELAQLAISKNRVKNYNIYVKEDRGKIVFLRKLIPGASSHSYGIEVANLAGVPDRVIKSAKDILARIEKSHLGIGTSIRGGQMALFNSPEEEKKEDEKDKIIEELMDLDPLSMSPLEAHSKLVELKEKLEKG